jgi:hypothetical protein
VGHHNWSAGAGSPRVENHQANAVGDEVAMDSGRDTEFDPPVRITRYLPLEGELTATIPAKPGESNSKLFAILFYGQVLDAGFDSPPNCVANQEGNASDGFDPTNPQIANHAAEQFKGDRAGPEIQRFARRFLSAEQHDLSVRSQ